jgi:hypothetical protein
MKSNLCAVAATLAVLTLTACGGGGGGSAPAPVTYTATGKCWAGPSPSNNISQASADFLYPSGCAVVNPTAALSLDSATGMPVIKVATGAVIADGTVTATVGSASTVYKVSATGATSIVTGSAPQSSTLVQYITKLNYANGPAEQTAGTFTTPASTFVWPTRVKSFAKMGTSISDWQTLVYGAGENAFNLKIGSDTWNSNLANGTVTIIESEQKAPDENGITLTLWGAVYYIPETKAYCVSPIRALTGKSYTNDDKIGYTCSSEKPTYVFGTKEGFVIKVASQQGRCYLLTVAKGTEDAVCPV